MPEKQTLQRARQAKRAGKRPTTQASEFVREEMHHLKEGKHGKESREQAIAIGLSKARRAGVALPAPKPGQAKRKTRRSAQSALRLGQREGELSESKRASPRRATTTRGAKKSPRAAAAGRTGRAKTASRAGASRRGSSTARSRSSSRTKTKK
ncbi:transcription elongation factor [Archangium violaceum]|uniref:DUF6496 domain-containing protein n=1 Tax=Archangium violaceum TaxID=83451 RepID=UPI00193B9FFC|nr:DUF6496 domain-containing protein [Archangium violaceum]QRK10275.1 transcription elongation factor [Archangium violaceum]